MNPIDNLIFAIRLDKKDLQSTSVGARIQIMNQYLFYYYKQVMQSVLLSDRNNNCQKLQIINYSWVLLFS